MDTYASKKPAIYTITICYALNSSGAPIKNQRVNQIVKNKFNSG